jgi:plasmid stabilization system protein ParE
MAGSGAAEPGIGNGVMRASARFLSEIYDALENLAQWPQRWPFYQHGTRRFVLHRFPFSVIYRDEPAVVSIVAIAHHKRRPGYWKDRT